MKLQQNKCCSACSTAEGKMMNHSGYYPKTYNVKNSKQLKLNGVTVRSAMTMESIVFG